MNRMMEDARKGAKDVGRLLESKQLRPNTQKSRSVVIGQLKSRTEILKDAEINTIMMGDTVIEKSKSEKYLGDQIHEDVCAASIAKRFCRPLGRYAAIVIYSILMQTC